jgi:hypothetical protein
MRRYFVRLIPLVILLFTVGCFEIEQSIDLQRDMTGTADLKIGIDFEPMVVIMAQMKKEMEGKTGALTKEELAAARAEFKAKAKKEEKKPDIKLAKSEMQKELPKGVKLLDFDAKEEEMRMISTFKFGFDKLQNLVDVKLPSEEGGDPTKKNLVDNPFEGLEVVENAKTITIRTKPQNPANEVKEETKQEGAKPDPEMEKMMKDAFKNLRIAYRITAPFEIVSHNATKKEGNTLIWVYDLEAFEKMEKAKKSDMDVKVVYKK